MDHRSRARHVSRRDFLVLTGAAAGALGSTRLGRDAALAAPRAQAAPGGTLTVGHIGDVDNYDPLTDALDQFQNYGRLLIFSSLTAYDAESALVGDLATEWELDGTIWVFKLRDGVTWHDGSPFTADDVKYTFERILDPRSRVVRRAHSSARTPRSRSSIRSRRRSTFRRSTPPIPT